MSFQSQSGLDEIDWKILRELQADARLSFSEIGRRVNLSQPTVADRVRRMEESGVIRGYHVDIDPTKVGHAITVFIRLKIPQANIRQYKLEKLIATELSEITECHRVTGDDCLLLKAHVPSIADLDQLLGKLNLYGDPHTSIVLSTTTDRPPLTVLTSHSNA